MRYAIYFMPQVETALWQFGSRVLGYDAVTRRDLVPPAELHGLPVESWTVEPRRYGFHGTLKAPFFLADGCSQERLLEHAKAFASQREAFEEPALQLTQINGFIGLTLERPSAKVAALADDAVRSFEPLRAPLTPQDRARRLQQTLPDQLAENLEQWGYPYVFEDFVFHMTLSISLATPDRGRFFAGLEKAYAPIASPIRFDGIAVFFQPAPDARFHVLERFALG